MHCAIPWSDNPRRYFRTFPAWYTLYRTLVQERLSRAELARIVGVNEDYVADRQGVAKLLHRDKTSYSLFDALAADIVFQFREEPEKVDFFERLIHDYESMLWHALIGVVQGTPMYISADFDKTMGYPFFIAGDEHNEDGGMVPIALNPSFAKILVNNTWPDFQVEISSSGRWDFKYQGRGYLDLEPLPLDADERDLRKEAADAEPNTERDEFGNKRLTLENFSHVDPIFHSYMWGSDPVKRDMYHKEHVQEIFYIRMHPSVPEEVREMFAILRGCLVYGYFYRPLFAVIRNQAYIVADAATWHRCKQLGSKPPGTFAERIELLKEAGVIPQDEGFLWDLARKFRNDAAHMVEQSMFIPGSEVGSLERIADDINRLFIPLFVMQRPTPPSNPS